MAQASRSAQSSASSEDALESLSTWFQTNSKLIGGVIGGAAVVGALIVGYRSWSGSTREKASTALYQAQGAFAEGKWAEAQSSLEKVATRYSGTASGQQAAVLAAQAMYEQKKYDDGIKALEKASAGASSDFKSAIEALIAAGYEMKGSWNDAATHYAKAADAAPFPADKHQYQASQARSLQAAGKTAEAKKLWETLAAIDGDPVQQEANVRLGELSAKP
ncbi:MAG: tetratricopeptide repeat protein [Gemmatimonadaceae bacterium]|nr:tetratricopeptide repeat protein [Gemmatimonadaceae bacterium]